MITLEQKIAHLESLDIPTNEMTIDMIQSMYDRAINMKITKEMVNTKVSIPERFKNGGGGFNDVD